MPCFIITPPSNNKRQNNPKKNTNTKKYKNLADAVDLLEKLKKKPGDLDAISAFVKANEEEDFQLSNNEQLILRVCDLNGTVYMGQDHMLESWQSFYLPKETKMEVLGAIDNYHGLQLVILVADNGHMYAYEEDRLVHIASSLPSLVQDGLEKNPCFYDLQELSDEEDETHSDEEVQKIRQRTKDFVNQSSEAFDKMLDFF
ncbi:uncharacterized protein LOC134611967 [Pelobates fuscus]|uniref:uncharacterized protein LOC134611967 n=1 Tax=Pelobates fuscus TaxID=191477 RepID=UPI002FE458DF